MLSQAESPAAERFLSGMSVCLSFSHSFSTPLGSVPEAVLDVAVNI